MVSKMLSAFWNRFPASLRAFLILIALYLMGGITCILLSYGTSLASFIWTNYQDWVIFALLAVGFIAVPWWLIWLAVKSDDNFKKEIQGLTHKKNAGVSF